MTAIDKEGVEWLVEMDVLQPNLETRTMKTAVEWLIDELPKHGSGAVRTFGDLFQQAKEMEKEQAELYAEFAVLNDRSGNPIIPFNEFINIDNL